MKFGRVHFELDRFGGVRALAKVGESVFVRQGDFEASPGPSVPSDPGKNTLFIFELEDEGSHEKEIVEKTIRNAGVTGATGTSRTPHPARSKFRFAIRAMEFGDVCAGWTPQAWACVLRSKADRCESFQPDTAAHYRRWAENIEVRLEAT